MEIFFILAMVICFLQFTLVVGALFQGTDFGDNLGKFSLFGVLLLIPILFIVGLLICL